ncbi:MAG: hypothetical protein K0S56_1298 [Microvirga sp.]|nr:hypothetical protein [Microvirga sp.]
MISSLANTILFVALVATSLIVVVMYRKLKSFELYHAEYKIIFEQTGAALNAAQIAVTRFSLESKDTLAALGQRVDEAKVLISEIDGRTDRDRSRSKPTLTFNS